MTSAERRTDDRDGYPPPALTAAVLGIITVILSIWAVAAIGETSTRAFATYAPVEVTVVDERTEMRFFADRLGGRLEPFRVVTVELADDVRVDVRSDDLTVGATATVYRDDAGAVVEIPPVPPGPLEWGLSAAIVAVAVVLAVVTVRSARRLRA
jgi:hypothetical protein